MKKILFIVAAVLLGIVFISSADAVTKEKSLKVTGDIVSNDGRQMVVRGGPSGDQAFDVSAVEDVQTYRPGDNVTILYREKDGEIKESRIKKNTREAG